MASSVCLDRELRRRSSSVEPTATVPASSTSSVTSVVKSALTPTKSPSTSDLMLSPIKPPAQSHKRRSTSQTKTEQDGHQPNSKRRRHSNKSHSVVSNGTTSSTKEDMFDHYQPWVIQTYGDSAKTKTISLRKYARVLRTLRGEESNSVENSKFRFWVKAKGFRIGQPPGYIAKPADGIVGSQTLSGDKEGANQDPPLYVPTATAKVGRACCYYCDHTRPFSRLTQTVKCRSIRFDIGRKEVKSFLTK
jgi:hypothetical protein